MGHSSGDGGHNGAGGIFFEYTLGAEAIFDALETPDDIAGSVGADARTGGAAHVGGFGAEGVEVGIQALKKAIDNVEVGPRRVSKGQGSRQAADTDKKLRDGLALGDRRMYEYQGDSRNRR